MCGRYFIDDSHDAVELHEIIESLNRRSNSNQIKMSGEIFPTDTVPVIANNRSMVRSAFAMAWGYTLPNGKRIINARSETAIEKTLFRDGMMQRRCVVPASNYFEWERRGTRKTKYAIRPDSDGLMYMAGIYRVENGFPVFSILTREPAESISFIHDRMPVILPAGIIADWINPRYKAEEILNEAILNIQYKVAMNPSDEQLRFDMN